MRPLVAGPGGGPADEWSRDWPRTRYAHRPRWHPPVRRSAATPGSGAHGARRTQLVILDEATSALDTATEARCTRPLHDFLGSDHADHRPPAERGEAGRPGTGLRGRADRRAGQARGPDRRRRPLRGPLCAAGVECQRANCSTAPRVRGCVSRRQPPACRRAEHQGPGAEMAGWCRATALGPSAPLRKFRGRWRNPKRCGSGLQPRCSLAGTTGASGLQIAPTTAAGNGAPSARQTEASPRWLTPQA